MVKRQLPNLKQNLDEFITYVKTREQKIDYLEKKVVSLCQEMNNQKEQLDQFLEEIELTETNQTAILTKNKIFTQQLQNSEATFAQMTSEKHSEKVKYEIERTVLQQRTQALEQEIVELKQGQKNVVEQDNLLIQLENKFAKLIDQQKNQTKDLLVKNQELVQAQSELKNQFEFANTKVTQQEQLTSKLLKQIQEYRQIIQEKQELLDKRSSLEMQLGSSGAMGQDDLMNLEIQHYKKMVMCSQCGLNYKQVILPRCNHMFCKQCVDVNLQKRNRACPHCKTKFGVEEIKNIYFT